MRLRASEPLHNHSPSVSKIRGLPGGSKGRIAVSKVLTGYQRLLVDLFSPVESLVEPMCILTRPALPCLVLQVIY